MKESEEMAAERRTNEKRLLDRSARSGEEINRRNSEAEGREAERFKLLTEIEKILDGIDREEFDDNGWWETSTGASFGKERLALIRKLFEG